MLMKRLTSALAGVSMAAVTAVAVTPTANAQADVIDDTRTVTFTCQGTDVGQALVSPTEFDVTFPEEVAPGEFFSVTLQPGQMRNNNRALQRITFDYALPANASIIGLNLGSDGLNVGGTAQVVRVDATSKTTSANGGVARIWGGVSARYGTSNSTNGTGGLTVNASTDFRLPSLEVVMRAPATVGEEISIGLPGANLTGFSAASTDFQWIKARTSSFSNNAVANECTSGADAAELTTTTVGDLDPVLLDTTTTVTSSVDVLGPNQPTTLTAQVGTQYGVLPQIASGDVTFRDATSDEILGTATPDSSGVASIQHTFDPLTPGQPDETRTVVAEFSGVDGDLTGSTSTPITVTLTGDPTVTYTTTFNLTAVLNQEDEGFVPVTVNASIVRPSGTTIPDGFRVQLFRGNTAIGEPMALPEGNTMSWTDSIERLPQTRTQTYRVESVPFVEDFEEWAGTSPAPVTVTVNGTDPSLDPPIVPGTGSLGALTGSLGSLTGS